MAKGGSKLLTGIVAFILGFIFAFLVLAGVVVGVSYTILSTQIDTLLEWAEVDNKDADGNYKYVNTDTENGGAATVRQLIQKLVEFANKKNDLTLGEIDELLPITDTWTGMANEYVYNATGVSLNVEELKTVKFSEISAYLNSFVDSIEIAPVLEHMSVSLDNRLIVMFLYGREADYVTATADGLKIPVYYDTFALRDGDYVRVADNAVLLQESLYPYLSADDAEEGEEQTYKLYYYAYGGKTFVTDGAFSFTADGENADGLVYPLYSEELAALTGDYYTEEDRRVETDPLTIGKLKASPFERLNGIPVTDVLGDEAGEIASEVFDGVTVGQMMNGEVNYDEVIKRVKITALLNDVKADDAVLTYLCYGVTGVTRQSDTLWLGTYKTVDEAGAQTAVDCYLETDEAGVVQSVYYFSGEERTEIGAATVADVSDRLSNATDDLTIADLVNVDASDSITMYLAYGVTGLDGGTETEDGYTVFAGTYEGRDIYVKALRGESGSYEAQGFYSDFECTERASVAGTTVSGVGDKMGSLTDSLALSDVLDVSAGEGSDHSIMAFVAFSLTDLKADEGDDHAYTAVYHKQTDGGEEEIACFVQTAWKDGKEIIKSAFYYGEEGERITADKTYISEVSDQINRVTKTLKVKDVVEIDEDDKFMVKVGEYKLNEIGDAVDTFELGDFMDIDPESAIMVYIAYDVTDVKEAEGEIYSHTGKYILVTEEGEEETVVYLRTVADEAGKRKVTGVYTDAACTEELAGVTIKDIPAQVDGLTGRLTIVDVVDLKVNPNNAIMVDVVYGVVRVQEVLNEEGAHLTVSKDGVTYYIYKGLVNKTEEYEGDACYIAATLEEDGTYLLRSFWQDAEMTVPLEVSATTIDGVTDKVNTISDDLTLGELVGNISENKVLRHLANSSINTLSKDIEKLAIQKVYADEIYGDDNGEGVKTATLKKAVLAESGDPDEILFDEAYLYYVLEEDGEFELVGGTGKVTRAMMEAGRIDYYTYGAAKGSWRFMLYRDGSEQMYSVNNLNELMDNTTANIGVASLFELAEADIISADYLYNADGTPKTLNGVELGSLTITGLIEAVSHLCS